MDAFSPSKLLFCIWKDMFNLWKTDCLISYTYTQSQQHKCCRYRWPGCCFQNGRFEYFRNCLSGALVCTETPNLWCATFIPILMLDVNINWSVQKMTLMARLNIRLRLGIVYRWGRVMTHSRTIWYITQKRIGSVLSLVSLSLFQGDFPSKHLYLDFCKNCFVMASIVI